MGLATLAYALAELLESQRLDFSRTNFIPSALEFPRPSFVHLEFVDGSILFEFADQLEDEARALVMRELATLGEELLEVHI